MFSAGQSDSIAKIEGQIRKLKPSADLTQLEIDHRDRMNEQAKQHLAWQLSAIEICQRLATLEARMPRQ